jgi:phosphoglycerate dehydrogenase-like enzyme
VLDDYQQRAHLYADWSSLGPNVEVAFFHGPIAHEQLAATLGEFHVLVLMRERTRFPRSALEALPRLRLVVTTGMVNASLDVGYLQERGVVVSGTEMEPRPVGVPSPVEVAWALILAVVKRVAVEDRAMRRGQWQRGLATDLAGATLGLAGLGRLGAAMVGPARAFGMGIVAWSQNLTGDRAADVGVEAVSKEELLSRSDVLSIHLVLSDRTDGAFGSAEFASMKSNAVLINTSRGPIVNEAALIQALQNETIAGAGLDVYDQEPLPANHPFTGLDNVVMLPHLGYATEPTLRQMYAQAVEDIAAFLGGAPLRLVDPDGRSRPTTAMPGDRS